MVNIFEWISSSRERKWGDWMLWNSGEFTTFLCILFYRDLRVSQRRIKKEAIFFWVRSLRHLKYIAMVVPKEKKSAENFFHVAFSFFLLFSAANMIKTPTTALFFWHRRDDDTSARFVLIIAIINFYFYDSPRAIKVNLINSHFPLWTDDYYLNMKKGEKKKHSKHTMCGVIFVLSNQVVVLMFAYVSIHHLRMQS